MKKLSYLLLLIICCNCSDNKKNVKRVEVPKNAAYIWQHFVPESGQAEFVQGELIRAISKLRDEAHRNANANFTKECHGILINYLREKLTDEKLFSETIITQTHKDLDRLNIENQPYTDDDIFDRIDYRIVEWYAHYGDGVKHTKNHELHC